MKKLTTTDRQVEGILQMLTDELSEMIIGIYLCGSAVLEGLKENSDLDFLVVLSEKLSKKTKENLAEKIKPLSRRIGKDSVLRYVEVTAIVKDQICNWTYPPKQEFIYGEWLYEAYQQGDVPNNEYNPSLAILLYQARMHHRTLFGQMPLNKIIPNIPIEDVKRAIVDSVDELVDQYDGDETNALLTLCRMILTFKTGAIYSKEVAGEKQAQLSTLDHRQLLLLAVKSYKGEELVQWNKYNVSKTISYLYDQLVELT